MAEMQLATKGLISFTHHQALFKNLPIICSKITVNVKNKSLLLGILASIFMFEGQNLGQGLLYVIE